MSKKFKGKVCAYCARETATTDDHVFAREFFLLADRHYLPKAPACQRCNNEKSKLEHYLTALLPIGGKHPQAAENLSTGVPGRLANNRKLAHELVASMKPAWIRDGSGLYQQTATFSLDGKKLEGLIGFMARGLAWHHWKLYLRPEDSVASMFMLETGSAIFQSMIANMRPAERVEESIGNGTVEYVGVQAADPPQLTIWHICMYGGLILSGERENSQGNIEACRAWCVMTGPPNVVALLEALKEKSRKERSS